MDHPNIRVKLLSTTVIPLKAYEQRSAILAKLKDMDVSVIVLCVSNIVLQFDMLFR